MIRPRFAALRALAPRLVAPVGAAALLVALPACDEPAIASREQLDERVSDVMPMIEADEPAPLPDDRPSMLRALAPLPSEALLVVYEIEGPAGIRGNFEVLARPGGYRRENWTIHVPMGNEDDRRLAGSTIQTPEGAWIEGSDPGTLSPSPLGALADAALALPEDQRRAVIESLEARRVALAEARADSRAEPEQILDVPCHVTRVATIEMCVWEATGLPLRYRSEGVSLRAVNIDLDASIGEHAFDLPFAPRGAVPSGFDPKQALRELIDGDLAGLSPYLHPGLRLPTSV